MTRTIFTVGPCKVVGGHGMLPDGTVIRSLTKRQYAAAKLLLLGMGPAMSHDELDDLREQMLEERRHQETVRQIRARELATGRPAGIQRTTEAMAGNGHGKVVAAGPLPGYEDVPGWNR